jgi:hypothetical protein
MKMRSEKNAMSTVTFGIAALLMTLALGCADAGAFHPELLPVDVRSDEPTASERLAACEQDTRVVSGLISREVCADAAVFASGVLPRDAVAAESARGHRRAAGLLGEVQRATRVDFFLVVSPSSRVARPRATSGT